MPGLMEFLDSISASGKDLIKDNPEGIKEFAPFAVNNGLAQAVDTIMFANEMNKAPWLSKELQYKFLLRSVSKKKRYNKWVKVDVEENQEDIDNVANHYSVNKNRAREYLKILTVDEVAYIKSQFDMGGASKVLKEAKATKPKKVK